MNIVHDQAFGAKTASYQTILQLDRKLRAFPVPAVLQIAGFGSSTPNYSPAHPDSLGLIMQRHIVLAIREMSQHSHFTEVQAISNAVLQICYTCIVDSSQEPSAITRRTRWEVRMARRSLLRIEALGHSSHS